MRSSRKPFTVVLRYPDHISDTGEFYSAFTMAANPEEALAKARRKAVFANGGTDDPGASDYIDPADFAVCAVYRGFCRNVSPE